MHEREVPAAGEARSEVAGSAEECAACAGVRAAWGQAWSCGCGAIAIRS